MRIGLLGFPFMNANKGCEALTFSIIHILRKMHCDEKLVIVSFNTKRNRLLEEQFPEVKFCSVRAKIKDGSCFREFRKCDFVFDVTSGDGFSDIYFKDLVFRTTLMKECVLLSGTPLILMPQTYGPFTNDSIRRFAIHTIKKSYRVYSRDQKSINYIEKFIKKDVLRVTDLAFSLPYNRREFFNEHQINVGLNVSGLLWRGGFKKQNQFNLSVNYPQYIKSVITTILDKGFGVHLIPHVIESVQDNLDGDVTVCRELYDSIEHDSLYLAPSFETPIEAKNYISGMDVFIGARMHSTIASFSAGVPVIPFSYSRKFEGLYENLDYPYVIHGHSESTQEAIEHTIEWIEDRNLLRESICKQLVTVSYYQKIFEDDLRKILSNRRK